MPDPRLATLLPGDGGRVYTHPETREQHVSVTTALKVINKPGLGTWRDRMVAEAAWRNREWLATSATEAEAVQALMAAPNAKRDDAGDHGTIVHEGCQLLAMGASGIALDVEQLGKLGAMLTGRQGPAVQAGLERFAEWAETYVDEWHHLEQTVFGPGYAGTFDALVTLRDGRLALLDYKTSKGVYAETVLQLAAYRYADAIWRADGTSYAIPDVDLCAVLHLPQSGGYSFRDLEVTETHRWAFLAALELSETLSTIPRTPGRPIRAPRADGTPHPLECGTFRAPDSKVRCDRPQGHDGDHQGPGPSGTRRYTWGKGK